MAEGCWKRIAECLGWFPEGVSERLKAGLGELCGTEAYQENGYPGIGRWMVEFGRMEKLEELGIV